MGVSIMSAALAGGCENLALCNALFGEEQIGLVGGHAIVFAHCAALEPAHIEVENVLLIRSRCNADLKGVCILLAGEQLTADHGKACACVAECILLRRALVGDQLFRGIVCALHACCRSGERGSHCVCHGTASCQCECCHHDTCCKYILFHNPFLLYFNRSSLKGVSLSMTL